MSRVSYAMLHEGRRGGDDPGGARRARRALPASSRDPRVHTNEIHEIALVGNPIMHHLAAGHRPCPWGSAPFALATDRAVRVRASELGLSAHPGARVYVLPCIAGHVGADTAGVILAEAPHRTGEVRLIVDVGTNAEIVLGNADRLLAASSPTGPAFEGAQIMAASERRPAPSSASASIPRPSSRGSGSSARRCGRTSPASPAAPGPASPASAAGASSRSSPSCSSPVSSRRTAHRRRARGADATCRLRRPDVQLRPNESGNGRPAHHR